MSDSGISIETLVDSRDFVRLKAEGILKIDLVNDRVFRHGMSALSPQGYMIDNLGNILANKLSAVLGRDEAKDVFDIAVIRGLGPIDWPTILESTARKCALDRDYLLYRLQSFPASLFDLLAVKREEDLVKAIEHLAIVVRELED
jgi:hypothetical protein